MDRIAPTIRKHLTNAPLFKPENAETWKRASTADLASVLIQELRVTLEFLCLVAERLNV